MADQDFDMNIISAPEMMATVAVFLIKFTTWLVKGGRMVGMACGKMIIHMVSA